MSTPHVYHNFERNVYEENLNDPSFIPLIDPEKHAVIDRLRKIVWLGDNNDDVPELELKWGRGYIHSVVLSVSSPSLFLLLYQRSKISIILPIWGLLMKELLNYP